MRPIDADKLHYKRVWIANIQDGEYRGMKPAVVVFADEIDKNKKARLNDVVPVVRCRDCEYSKPWYADKRLCSIWHEDGTEDSGYASVWEDGFCSYGKQKDGDSIG